MLPVTVDSTLAWLLPFAPDWSTAPVSAFELLTAGDDGLSAREHRRALSATLRTTLQFAAQLTPAEADQFFAALAVPDNRPLLVPFWAAESSFAERTSVAMTGGLRVWFERDWSAYHIGLAAEENPAGYSATARTAPLLWARWNKRPIAEALTADGELDVSIELTDVGPAEYALAPQGGALVYGAPVGGVATPKLPNEYVNWVKPGASSEIVVSTERLGYGRGEVEEYVAQQARQTQKLAVRCLRCDEIARLVRLFLDRRGDVGTWWCPSFRSAEADDALLVRFKAAKLQLTWATPTQADAQLEVIAVPTEEMLPADETRGSTIGDLGTRIWLYRVTDGDLTWRYTSFESTIDAGALGTYEHREIGHGDITSEINLQRHDVDLTVGWFAGSPFERARLDRLAPPLTVQIYEGTLAAPAAAELIFTGKAAGYRFEGGKCTCKIAGPTALFDVRGPVAVTSPRCWTPMYSPLCGLSREAMGVPATLIGIDSDGTLRFEISGGASMPADHYRYGYAERISPGGERRRYRITGSGEYASAVVIPSLPGLLQAETAAWQAAVATAGGTLGSQSLAIADALVVELRAKSWYAKLLYLLPLLGADLAAATTPLVDSGAKGRPTLSGISADDFSEPTGLTFSGAALMDLPFYPNAIGASGAGGWGVWELAFNGGQISHGYIDETFGDHYLLVLTSSFADARWGTIVPNTAHAIARWFGATQSAVNLYGQYYAPELILAENGVVVAANSDSRTLAGAGLHTLSVGATRYRNWDTIYSRSRIGCIYVTDGTLTAEEIADLHTTIHVALMLPTLRISGTTGIYTDRHVPPPASFPDTRWTLVPGCDHSWGRCKRLGNSDNFRGCPHFPKSNPAMVSVKQETATGSKK